MPDFERLEKEFEQYDRGEARLNAIRAAITEADLANDLQWQFWFRYDYVEESIFCGDRYYALICFPELLKLYQEHETLQENTSIAHSFLITFKWIVEAAPEFPQISKEEIDSYFREFKKELRKQGKSLSGYYMKRCLFYMHVDKDIASMCFYRFVDEPLDDSSDGRALYFDQQAEYYLYVGEEEKARNAAKDIFDGKLTSSCLPHATYHDFIAYFIRHRRFEEAAEYARKIEHRVNGDPYYHDIIGTLLTLWAECDLEHACAMFNRNYPAFQTSKNPWLRVLFAIGASHLFDKLKEDPQYYANIQIPGGGDPAKTGEQIRQTAEELARKFDARNGTDDFMQLLLHPYVKE